MRQTTVEDIKKLALRNPIINQCLRSTPDINQAVMDSVVVMDKENIDLKQRLVMLENTTGIKTMSSIDASGFLIPMGWLEEVTDTSLPAPNYAEYHHSWSKRPKGCDAKRYRNVKDQMMIQLRHRIFAREVKISPEVRDALSQVRYYIDENGKYVTNANSCNNPALWGFLVEMESRRIT